MRLKYKFGAYIFIFGGLFLSAISALSFIEIRQGEIQSQSVTFQKNAEERAEHIAITLKEKARIASIIARSAVVISAIESSNAAFATMDEVARRDEIKRLDEMWMKAVDENDPVVRAVMVNPAAEYFRGHELAFPGEYGEIFLTNRYGVTIAATKKLTTLAHAHKYWWIAANNNGAGRVFFDDRGYDMSAKGYVIGVTVPIIKNGKVIGIIKCNQDMISTLNKVVEGWSHVQTGRLVIAREKGKIVLGPGLKPLSFDLPNEILEKMKGRDSGHMIINTGVPTLVGFASLKISDSEGEYGFGGASDSIDNIMGNRGEVWRVVISQSLAEATAGSVEQTKVILFTGLALIGLMGLAAVYFGGKLAEPVSRMGEFARKIGDGDYDVQVEDIPGGEMGRLASAFNQMAINLKTTTTTRDKLMEEVERRRGVEYRLRESEQRFRRLAEAAFEGISVSEKGMFLDVNRRFLEMFGYDSINELLGRSALELTAPEYRGIVTANIAAGYDSPYEVEGLRKDGSRFPLEIHGKMINIEGRVIRITALRDMTERKEAEEALRRKTAELDIFFSTALDLLCIANTDGYFVRLNPQWEKTLGYTLKDMEGKRFLDFVHPDDLDSTLKAVSQLSEQKPVLGFTNRYRHQDGTYRWIEWRSSPAGNLIYAAARDITERKSAEDSIRESNEILERIFETTHSHVVLLDTRFNFIRVNKAYADVCGFPPEYFVGKNHFELYPSEELESKFRTVTVTGVPYIVYSRPFEFPDHPELGVTYWDLAVYPVKGTSGEVEGILFTLLDVTDRKKAEETLRQTRQLLESIVDNIPAMIFLKRADDLRFALFNRAGENLLGYSRDDLIGKCDYDFFPKEQADFFTNADRKVLASKETTDIPEEPIKVANGETRYLHTWKIALRDEAGEPSHLLGISLDITERKKAEEALAASEKKLRDITSVLGQGVYAMDTKGLLTFMNPEAERLLGWTEAELLGRDIHNIFHNTHADGRTATEKECPAHMAIHSGSLQVSEGGVLTRKDGGSFPAHIVATPIIEKGRIAGAVVVFSDITERLRIMQEVTEARNRAEDATKLKDKFVSLVAHDLKSPLSSILGLLEVMDEDLSRPLDERRRDILDHVLESGRRMVSMINDLLDITRLQTGKITPNPKFFNAFMAAQIAVNGVMRQAQSKGARIENDIPPTARLYGDVNLFGEVLTNLLTNAVKFSRANGVITVFSPADGAVAVKDSGVGISETVLPFIFLHDVKTTTPGTSGERGTGLGLPLSHDIMIAMRGDLTVESEEGKGSVFYAQLPVARPKALVVDDEGSRLVARQNLERIGVETIEAGDTETALELVERERPHIIITGALTPNIDGLKLIATLKGNPATATIPVITLAADDQMETRETAFRAGADDVMAKPIQHDDLASSVRRFVG